MGPPADVVANVADVTLVVLLVGSLFLKGGLGHLSTVLYNHSMTFMKSLAFTFFNMPVEQCSKNTHRYSSL